MKKKSSPISEAKGDEVQTPTIKTDRAAKILNCITNTSLLLLSTFMGAFTEVMVTAAGNLAGGFAEAVNQGAGDKVEKEFKQKRPEVDEKMKRMVSDMRKEMSAELEQKREEIKPLLSDSKFDAGPRIVERYDFGLPKLTEELDDDTFARYMLLMQNEDSRFAEMFKELADWMNELPKSPAEKSGK
ncbi:MAG: hypothetical protein ACE14S_10885 [Candidatus Bathyarchaeia archaeon]